MALALCSKMLCMMMGHARWKSAASSMKVVPKKPVAMSMSAKPKFKMTIKPVNLLGGDDDE